MNDFYCAAPWRGLHINPRGDIKTCCAGNSIMLGNPNNKSITEILNGPELAEIRTTLSQGNPHPYCSSCINIEKYGGSSERAWHNNKSPNIDYATAGNQYHFPAIVDVRWNNTCNLSCNYCAPVDSSKWASLRSIPVNTSTRHYYTAVCDFIEQHYDHVQEVALVGGEPLLLKENIKLLDVIPEDCVVTIITNLNNPLENNEIFKKLARRKRVGWSMSFDNIGSRFEYVRHGASWDLQLHNLDLVQELMRNNGHWGGIHAIYNLYNATRLVEFKQFATARGLSIKWHHLDNPKPLNPRNYGQEIAKLATKEIERVFENCSVDHEEQVLFGTALEHYQSITDNNVESLTQLQQFILKIEQYHPDQQGKFCELWPEISNLL
jgi:MoaA/NifB/PqqE/SkfB family radical SAM enzyme